jgi:hypothetical protein
LKNIKTVDYLYEEILRRVNTQGNFIYRYSRPGWEVKIQDGKPVELKKRKLYLKSDLVKKADKHATQFAYKTPGATKGGAIKAKITREKSYWGCNYLVIA